MDSNKIIGELQLLDQELGDKDAALVTQAVDLIEHLVETRVSPPADLDLRLYVSQLITILGNVSMNLSGGARPNSYPWVQQTTMPYPPPGCHDPR